MTLIIYDHLWLEIIIPDILNIPIININMHDIDINRSLLSNTYSFELSRRFPVILTQPSDIHNVEIA